MYTKLINKQVAVLQDIRSIYKNKYFSILAMDNLKVKLGKEVHFNGIKRIKLGVKLTKEMQYLYIENQKTMLKEVQGLNKCKAILCSWTGRITLRWQYSPN